MEFLKKLFFTCCFRNKDANRDIDDIDNDTTNKIEEAESMMIDMDSSIHKTNMSKRSQLREQQRSQEKIQLTKLDNTRVYSSRRQAMIFKEDSPLPERKKIWK